MLDHVSIPVSDLERSASFYDSVLSTLGFQRRKERPGAIGYGPLARNAPIFWLLSKSDEGSAHAGIGLHVSFQALDRSIVDNFHKVGLQCGGVNAGDPGVRPEYTTPFYGAFLIDPDGFKIEAVCRSQGDG